MNTKFRTFMLVFLIANPLTVFAMSNAPKYCPGIEAVKQTPFVKAEIIRFVGWGAITTNTKFDTPDEWTGMAVVPGYDDTGKERSQSEAIAIANTYLQRIKVVATPVPEKSSNGAFDYDCVYVDDMENPKTFVSVFTPAYQDLGEKLLQIQKRHSFLKR